MRPNTLFATIARIDIDFSPIARVRFSVIRFFYSLFFYMFKKTVEFCANISFIVSQFCIDFTDSLSLSHSHTHTLTLSLSHAFFLSYSCFSALKNERSDCSANKIIQRDRSPLISIPGTPILFARELNYKRPSVSQ